jgi:hypothetical protein
MVGCGVAAGQIAEAVRLVVQALVVLAGVSDVSAVMVVEFVIGAAIVAPLIKRRGNGKRRLGANRLCQRQFVVSVGALRQGGRFALPLDREEDERLVFL